MYARACHEPADACACLRRCIDASRRRSARLRLRRIFASRDFCSISSLVHCCELGRSPATDDVSDPWLWWCMAGEGCVGDVASFVRWGMLLTTVALSADALQSPPPEWRRSRTTHWGTSLPGGCLRGLRLGAPGITYQTNVHEQNKSTVRDRIAMETNGCTQCVCGAMLPRKITGSLPSNIFWWMHQWWEKQFSQNTHLLFFSPCDVYFLEIISF